MKRKHAGIGLAFALMVVFIAALNRLDGNRSAQLIAAAVYVVTMIGLLRWTIRGPA
jgi:hypothetical protein